MEAQEQIYANQPTHSPFIDFVKSVEIHSQNQILHRKNKVLMKKKMKDIWLHKSKIIPPTFTRFCKENYENYYPKASLRSEEVSYHQYDCDINVAEPTRIQPEQTPKRYHPKQSHISTQIHQRHQLQNKNNSIHLKSHTQEYRKITSCDDKKRIKTANWKLEFRKDELNVLKFTKSFHDVRLPKFQEDKAIEEEDKCKKNLYKIKRLQKKHIDIRFENGHPKTNIADCEENGINRGILRKRFALMKSNAFIENSNEN